MPKNKRKAKSNYKNKIKARRNPGDDRHRLNHKRIRHLGLREAYNKDKTWLQNMKDMDFKMVFEHKLATEEDLKKTYHVPKVNEDEVIVLKKLHAKYCERSGDDQDNTPEAAQSWDFTKMARDIKINKWQWPAAKVEKLMMGHFVNKDIKQRSAEAETESGHSFKRARWLDEDGKKRNIFGH